MVLTSFTFGLFYIGIFFLYWLFPKCRRYTLLLANVVFCASFGWRHLIVLGGLILISFYGAILIEGNAQKRSLFIICLILVCSGLVCCKYGGFVARMGGIILDRLQFDYSDVAAGLIVPLGISYYTFQAISYITDVYKGKIKAERSLLTYACYLSFFLTISSGPIERAGDMMPQISGRRQFEYSDAVNGLERVLWGCFKKLVIADNLSVFVNMIGENIRQYDGFVIVLAGLGFTLQLYCDFSGYSDMVIGFARMLNIHLEENFKCPYFSASIKEFWSRWHISLSHWLKDYIYIPMGGNRCSKFRNMFNLLCTFLISGIWHGAGVKFLIWGGMHGILQCLEKCLPRAFRNKNINATCNSLWDKIIISTKIIVTFLILNFTWLPFWLPTTRDFVYAVTHMFAGVDSPVNYLQKGIAALGMSHYMWCCLGIALLFLFVYEYKAVKKQIYDRFVFTSAKVHFVVRIVILLFVLCCNSVAGKNFIYFQF